MILRLFMSAINVINISQCVTHLKDVHGFHAWRFEQRLKELHEALHLNPELQTCISDMDNLQPFQSHQSKTALFEQLSELPEDNFVEHLYIAICDDEHCSPKLRHRITTELLNLQNVRVHESHMSSLQQPQPRKRQRRNVETTSH